MSATNKNIAKLLRQEIWNTGNFAIADEICADDAVFHNNDPLTPDFGQGPQALKQLVTMYRAAFPDAHITIEDIVAEGNRVVIRWTGRGTHKGTLGRIAATGKAVVVTGIDLVRLSKGKVQENWTNWDTLGMLQQLGVQQVAAAGA
jgi:steroid delta-isomerase-like uncharacterized protein